MASRRRSRPERPAHQIAQLFGDIKPHIAILSRLLVALRDEKSLRIKRIILRYQIRDPKTQLPLLRIGTKRRKGELDVLTPSIHKRLFQQIAKNFNAVGKIPLHFSRKIPLEIKDQLLVARGDPLTQRRQDISQHRVQIERLFTQCDFVRFETQEIEKVHRIVEDFVFDLHHLFEIFIQ